MSSSSRPRTCVLRTDAAPALAGGDWISTVRQPVARDLVVDPALVEAARAEGYADGYRAGHEQGTEEAHRSGAAALADRLERLRAAARTLESAAAELRARETATLLEAEDQIVAAACALAEVLVGAELTVVERRGRAALARALALAPSKGVVVARLHPDDAAALAEPAAAAGRDLEIVADPTLAPGDCVVDAGTLRIDARLGPALARVRALLAGAPEEAAQ